MKTTIRLFICMTFTLLTATSCVAQSGVKSFEECVAAGFPIQKMKPPRCTTSEGKSFVKGEGAASASNAPKNCQDLCGNGTCESIVCMGVNCPCAETHDQCPSDCSEEG